MDHSELHDAVGRVTSKMDALESHGNTEAVDKLAAVVAGVVKKLDAAVD